MTELMKTISGQEIRKTYLNNCSSSTFWRLRRSDPNFPKPLSFGAKRLWSVEDLQSWYDQQRASNSNEGV